MKGGGISIVPGQRHARVSAGRSGRVGGAGLLLSRGGEGGGGFGPKTWCTKNGLTRFSLL